VSSVILQPAGDPYARAHYAETIATPVPLERLERRLSTEDLVEIRRLYGTRPVPTWGVTPGGNDVNRNKWERIGPGDIALMVRDGEVFVSARVTYKTHNEPLAEELWGRNDVGATWEYLYFLDDLTPQSLLSAELNEILGYQPGARVQGFNVLDQAKSDTLLDALGLDDTTQPDALRHLRSLVGTAIPTLTGSPNRIIEVRPDEVIVGTERSPEGQPVPIEWVQTAMDRLFRDGEVDINVESVGHRSAFVGAALASLPGTRTENNPLRVLLAGSATRPAWREPPEIGDAIDAVTELAGRGPARRQGRRQSAAERKAIEMRAISMATRYFESRDWHVEYVGGVASYDLECTKDDRSLHVEVKGTTSRGEKVLLTRNEVAHARGTEADLALYVLTSVMVETAGDEARADGGVDVILHPWELEDSGLQPVGYEYTLPPSSSLG
jgi:Domain of unknown function (DUF3883)